MSGFVIDGAECVYETEKAICIKAPMFDEDKWVPKSVVTDESEVYKKGTTGNCIVSEWFADKEGWS